VSTTNDPKRTSAVQLSAVLDWAIPQVSADVAATLKRHRSHFGGTYYLERAENKWQAVVDLGADWKVPTEVRACVFFFAMISARTFTARRGELLSQTARVTGLNKKALAVIAAVVTEVIAEENKRAEAAEANERLTTRAKVKPVASAPPPRVPSAPKAPADGSPDPRAIVQLMRRIRYGNDPREGSPAAP